MDFETLRGRLRGTLIASYEPDFGSAVDALTWNGRKPPRRARLIVRAADAADVQQAVRFAATHGLSVSPRGGGHHFTGISTQADMVIDLGALDGLSIDPVRRTALVGPAVTNARLAAALDRQGLAFPVGHCGSVPISGYLLGGGVGWNAGSWGIACFSLEEAEIVTPDGQLRRASADQNPDLFWAVRGAGPGFFGVVTAYRVRLQEAPRSIMSTVRIYPVSEAHGVADWAERAMASAPANVEFTVKIAAPPPQADAGDAPVVEAIATVFAASEDEARGILASVGTGAPEPLMTLAELPSTFEQLYAMTDQALPKGRRYGVDSLWSDARLTEVLPKIAAGIAAAPSRNSLALVVLRAPSAVPPGEAAFSRIGRIFGGLFAAWDEASDDPTHLGWLRGLAADLAPLRIGSYVGEADLDQAARRSEIHSPEAAARLGALRAAYDPAGLFGQPLRPADRAAA